MKMMKPNVLLKDPVHNTKEEVKAWFEVINGLDESRIVCWWNAVKSRRYPATYGATAHEWLGQVAWLMSCGCSKAAAIQRMAEVFQIQSRII